MSTVKATCDVTQQTTARQVFYLLSGESIPQSPGPGAVVIYSGLSLEAWAPATHPLLCGVNWGQVLPAQRALPWGPVTVAPRTSTGLR